MCGKALGPFLVSDFGIHTVLGLISDPYRRQAYGKVNLHTCLPQAVPAVSYS